VILASGILSVAVPPSAVNAVDQFISVPVVPMAKVIPVFVSPILFPIRVTPVPKVRTDSLELKVFQSVAERAPVVVVFAMLIPNTPVVLLYVSGPRAESAVNQILLATVPERVERLLLVVARDPESEKIFEFVAVRLPERVHILPVSVFTVPERAFCARVSVK
jgi:hypothetical protein